MKQAHVLSVAILTGILTTGGAPLMAQGDKPEARASGGAIVGRTVRVGKVHRNPPIDMACDAVCASQHTGREVRFEKVLVDKTGGLANVIVWIKNVPKGNYPVRRGRVILDQVGCRYVPHVFCIQLGQELVIRSSDSTAHSVRFKSKLNGDWNMTQPGKGDVSPREKFRKPEVGTSLFKCDIHPWMEARVGIFDHPFFGLSKADGTFQIPTAGLPAGKHEVWARHEKYGDSRLKDVEVKAGKKVSVTLNFK